MLGGLWMATPGVVVGLAVLVRTILGQQGSAWSGPTPWLASALEETAFREIESRFPVETHLISAHMLLADVVGRQRLDFLDGPDRIFCWKAHCDFVVVDRRSLQIRCVIEVDGPSHLQAVQRIRDLRKTRILERCGIELFRLSVRRLIAVPHPHRG